MLETFGRHLFSSLAKNYPHFFPDDIHFLDFLSGIHDYIHVEVRKLYPDAELPEFEVEREADDQLVIIYKSTRHMEALAEGLMEAAAKHFGESFDIQKEKTSPDNTRFTLTRI